MSEGTSDSVQGTAPTTPGRRGLTIGRFVNLTTLVLHVATFITALCVIGAVGKILLDFKNSFTEVNYSGNTNCPFYANAKPPNDQRLIPIEFAHDGVCVWFIAGHVILAVSVIAFFIVGIVRVIFAMDIGIIGTLIEIACTALLILLTFAVAVSLSIGVVVTCDRVQLQTGNCAGEVGCVQIGSEQVKVCWYGNAQSAQGAAWAALVFLVVFLIVSLIRLCIWGRRWKLKRQRQALQNYAQLEEEKPAAI